MSDAGTGFFSYKSFAGLQIVCDNAKSHAPFPKKPSEQSSNSRAPSPIRPERGLTRWGSQEDLHCQIPRQPSRGSREEGSCTPFSQQDAATPLLSWEPPQPPPAPPPSPSVSPPEERSRHLLYSTRIEGIRSRWNSQICRDEEALGKISTSPTIPRRCLEDVMVPAGLMEDGGGSGGADKNDVSILSQVEGVCWKRIICQRAPSHQSRSNSSDRTVMKVDERSQLNAISPH